MIQCAVCRNYVTSLKLNSHVIPKAWIKETKQNDGKNVQFSTSTGLIRVNQKDDTGAFWCECCEAKSSKDDGYGANLLLKKFIGRIIDVEIAGRKFKIITEFNYQALKRFILSIPIREYLARKVDGGILNITDEEKSELLINYTTDANKIKILAQYIEDSDPLALILHGPTRNKGGDGVTFQLLNFRFILFFKGIEDLDFLKLTDSRPFLIPVTNSFENGNIKYLQNSYERLILSPENQKVHKQINEKLNK